VADGIAVAKGDDKGLTKGTAEATGKGLDMGMKP
jgi:hypothetical protein